MVILLVGIGLSCKKQPAYARSKDHLRATPTVHDLAETASTISLKHRPRSR
jgi:hypothetical protein